MAMSRREMDALIIQRAWKDEAFRAAFMADPTALSDKYPVQKLPAEINLVALAEDDKTIHFVIPPKPANADQLSDEDLEKVAGGIDAITLAVVGGIALAAALGLGIASTEKDHGW